MQMLGLCLLAAVLVMLLRQMHPAMAGLLSAAFGVLAVSVMLPDIQSYMEEMTRLLSSLSLDTSYVRIMLKAMGIVLVTQLAVQVCQDVDAPSIAKRAELCGRIALMGVAMPVFMELTQMAVDVLR